VIDRTARILLSARRTKDRGSSLARRALPFVTGVVLLFYSGYCERYLRHDPSSHALRLYLFSLMCITCALSAAHFTGVTREILRRTAVFPVSGRSRFTFVALGTLFNPVSIAFLLSGGLSVGILFGQTLLARALSVANFAALVFLAQLHTIVALLLPISRQRSAVLAGSGLMLVLLLPPGISILLDNPGSIPVLGWAVAGIQAATAGDAARSLLFLSYLSSGVFLMGAIGRRVS
jgi:hypothetical protein